eukprot:SAG31_NODE_1515_length_8037_cov_2.470773_8_plen_48_part_00
MRQLYYQVLNLVPVIACLRVLNLNLGGVRLCAYPFPMEMQILVRFKK